jgi:hypothetical protein
MAPKAKTRKGGNAKSTRKHAAKKPATVRLSAEQLSDQEAQRLLLHHKRKLKPLLEAEKNAKAAVVQAKELAKKEGVPWKELQIALSLETEEGAEKHRLEMERLLRLDRWMGTEIGEQLEMFAKTSATEKAFEDGRRAALDNEPRKPPLHLSDSASKSWMSGHEAGTAHVNKARQSALGGFIKLSDVLPKDEASDVHQESEAA